MKGRGQAPEIFLCDDRTFGTSLFSLYAQRLSQGKFGFSTELAYPDFSRIFLRIEFAVAAAVLAFPRRLQIRRARSWESMGFNDFFGVKM